MPGGYLVIHLVNRENFDPIIPAGDQQYLYLPKNMQRNVLQKASLSLINYEYKANFNILSDNIEKNHENKNEDYSPSAVLKEVIRNTKPREYGKIIIICICQHKSIFCHRLAV